MTRDDIIRMYKEANGWSPEGFDRTVQELERFAALVRADERDRAMRENAYVAAENEACAKVCEDEAWRLKKLAVDTGSSATNTRAIQASNDADLIRARSKT